MTWWRREEYDKFLNETDTDEITNLLLYRRITKVENNTLYLDNGTTLEIVGNEGCGGCSSGWYEVTELNECDNAITNVEFVCDGDTRNSSDDTSYKIFVYAENKRIKIAQVDGSDGNGYYGTGYSILVRLPK